MSSKNKRESEEYMAKPALQSELSSVADDLLSDDQAGHVPGDPAVVSRLDAGGVVRPFVRRGGRRVRETEPGEEWPSRLYRDDSQKGKTDESVVLRPVFPKTPGASGIAQFFLEPPKSIPVVEGVRPRVEGK